MEVWNCKYDSRGQFFFMFATKHGRSFILLGFFIVQTCYIEFGGLNSGYIEFGGLNSAPSMAVFRKRLFISHHVNQTISIGHTIL